MDKLSKLVRLCKNRGIVFPCSEIYGGLAGAWDYGPLGAQMKKNIMDAWWTDFVTRRRECVGLESSVLLSPRVWEASGHVDTFSDPLTECTQCGRRYRADKLLEAVGAAPSDDIKALGAQLVEMGLTACAACGGELSPPRSFNLMFESRLGADASDGGSSVYFRPETAQGAYVNFAQIYRTMRRKLPFGIGQCGKSFRNEISPGSFIFRTREFEQLELQWFCEENEAANWYRYWVEECHAWLLESCGLQPDSVRLREHTGNELAHYARATTDIEFAYPFGWGELWGIADRGAHDLRAHSEASGETLEYRDSQTAKGSPPLFPIVIEPALGVNRLLLAVLCDAYVEEEAGEQGGGGRTVLRLPRRLAPSTFAVLPLAKKPEQLGIASELHAVLSRWCVVDYDEAGSIGKRYRRQDEVGTPFCVTIDYESVAAQSVTVRERDSMRQVRVPLTALDTEERALAVLEGLK